MRGRKPSTHAYDHSRGEGWILTSLSGKERHRGRLRFDVVLYYTDEERIETHQASNVDTLLRQLLDIGAQLGSYPGAKPEPDVEFSDQPRTVRMQRHATDIYDELGDVRGMSPTIAIRAAEEFGSRWSDKTDWNEWQERVKTVGKGRAGRFAAALS